ncbi:MAG: S26 family signal peptidase, partial [Pseudomonadota bacterium]
ITVRSLHAPLFLYPSSASLPVGLYMRSFETVQVGSIVAFPVPAVARRYQEHNGNNVPHDYLFIKPVAAGPGDRVCNDPVNGLQINGVWLAPVAKSDSRGKSLPVWRSCRLLRDKEFFLFSNTVPNSFDSRYYGTVQDRQIRASYRRVS